MFKFIVEIGLDGYDSLEEEQAACSQHLYEQLNMAAAYVKISPLDDAGSTTGNQEGNEYPGYIDLKREL